MVVQKYKKDKIKKFPNSNIIRIENTFIVWRVVTKDFTFYYLVKRKDPYVKLVLILGNVLQKHFSRGVLVDKASIMIFIKVN